MKTHAKAFTLLEMLGVLAIAIVLVITILPTITQRITDAQMDAEDLALETLKKDILRSLDSSDVTNVNLLTAVNADSTLVGSAPTATVFSTGPDQGFTSTSAAHWFAKIAAGRGSSFTSAAPTQAAQPALAAILYNRFSRARMVVLGPAETNQQRILLISLVAPNAQLVMPSNDGSAAWFNTIWNTDWNTRSQTLPTTGNWNTLTTDQRAAWNSGGSNASRLYKLRVVRVTVPKYTLNISNNHPTANAYVYSNFDNNRLDALASTGVTVSSPILGGRQIRVLRGTSLATATEVSRFMLRENSDILIQSN